MMTMLSLNGNRQKDTHNLCANGTKLVVFSLNSHAVAFSSL